MKYKKRLARISSAVSKFEEGKMSLDDSIDHFRPIMTRYAEHATDDRLNGNIERWQRQSFPFVAAAYCTYLRDKADIPQFVDNILEQRHMDAIAKGSNDKGYYFYLWVAMKIIVPGWLDIDEAID